jgi:Protein of unknown function (DUF4238)
VIWKRYKDDSGGFVTTDHPVCARRPGEENYGQQYAPGLGLSDQDILFPLASDVALIGRLEGEEDVQDFDQQSVARFNATVMGYALRQIYAADDQCYYARPLPQTLGKISTLLDDSNLKVREDSVDLSNLAARLSNLAIIESTELAKLLKDKWKLSGGSDPKS